MRQSISYLATRIFLGDLTKMPFMWKQISVYYGIQGCCFDSGLTLAFSASSSVVLWQLAFLMRHYCHLLERIRSYSGVFVVFPPITLLLRIN